MIAALTRSLRQRDAGRIVVETGGIGYELFIPLSTYYRLPAAGAAVELAVRQLVREGAITLYGFVTIAEKQAFALGRPDEALKLSDEALRRARQLMHSYSLATALMAAAALRYQRREPEAARELAEASMALAEEHGFRERSAEGRSFRRWATAEPSQEQVAELEAGAAVASGFFQLVKPAALVQVYVRSGRADQALVMLSEELARLERSGAHPPPRSGGLSAQG